MDRLFNMDNKFFVFMGRVADLIILNLLCIVCCIPVITAGASITAMFYVTLKMVRNEESYIVRGFFKSFKQNFKQATIINLILLVATALLLLDMNLMRGMQGTITKVLSVIFMMIGLILLMIFIYIYPVLAKFYNTIRNTFVNAFLMSVRHLPFTLLMIVISALPVAMFFIPSAQMQSLILMLFFLMGFATIAYINSNFLVRIFDNYIPEEKEEETNPEDAYQAGIFPMPEETREISSEEGTGAAIGSDNAGAVSDNAAGSGNAADDGSAGSPANAPDGSDH